MEPLVAFITADAVTVNAIITLVAIKCRFYRLKVL